MKKILRTPRLSRLAAAAVAIAAFCQTSSAYEIFPVPRLAVEGATSVSFPTSVNLIVTDGIGSPTADRAREVLSAAGIAFTESDRPTAGTDLLVGVYDSGDMADSYARKKVEFDSGLFSEADHRFDAHVVSVTDNGDMVVLGNSEGSAFYGLATLEQILEQATDGKLTTVTVQDYSHTRFRGIVEGFYGHPFSVENRMDIFDYMKRYKLNYYLYAPKADPYHTGKWREAYPESITDEQRNLGQITAGELQQLATKAKECGIDLVWACHPALEGNAINFYNLDEGVSDIMTKFEIMYGLGFRHFGVSVDDISGHPSRQWELADKVQKAIDTTYNTDDATEDDRVGHLIFVPSQYALNYDRSYSSLSPFRQTDPNVEIAFTGYDCFSNVRASAFDTMADVVGRDPVFWWNNPVNDDYDEFLYMHGLCQRWIIEQKEPIEHMKGLLVNPMNQGQASKIAFFNAADYAWNPAAFDERKSFEGAVESLGHTAEYTDALHKFIRCLSSYTTHDTRTPEGEEFAGLYEQCRRSIANGTTDGFAELHTAMTETRDACRVLQTMAESDRADQRLLHADIGPWLNKIEDMSAIVADALELITGDGDPENWTASFTLARRAEEIHTADRYRHSALEGHGVSTYEVIREVEPTPKYMDDFVDFIASAASAYNPSLPPRDKEPGTVTNFGYVDGLSAKKDGNIVRLVIPATMTLDYGCYAGIDLKGLHRVKVTPLGPLTAGIEIETSVNGKNWTAFDRNMADGETATEFAYIRLINPDLDELSPGIGTLSLEIEETAVNTVPEVSTNMYPYLDYVIGNVVDGDPKTFFWKNTKQATGDYITLDYGTTAKRGKAYVLFNEGDHPTGSVTFQISDDGRDWTDAVKFGPDRILENRFDCDLGGVAARFVRLYFEPETTGNWLQVAEISVESFAADAVSAATDSIGNPISGLDDRLLTSAYRPTAGGSLTYRFTENLTIDKVCIYHHSDFTPSAPLPSILARSTNGEWVGKGLLDKACTTVDVSDIHDLAELRIEWEKPNLPAIYEIYPTGEPYSPEKPLKPVSIEPNQYGTAMPEVVRNGSTIAVNCQCAIIAVEVYGTDGRRLGAIRPGEDAQRAEVRDIPMPAIVRVTTSSESGTTTLTVKI